MKITIDTTYKTISIQETIKLDELMDDIKKMLPNWKEYSLVSNNNNNTTYNYPYVNYPVTYGTGVITNTTTSNQ